MFQLARQCSFETELSEEPPLKGQVTRWERGKARWGGALHWDWLHRALHGYACGDLGSLLIQPAGWELCQQ